MKIYALPVSLYRFYLCISITFLRKNIEKLFYFRNNTTIIPVAEARGVILTALEQHKIKFAEYTPMEIKQILTGYGKATKQDVKQHVQLILNQELPKLDDTIDAIGIAICHTRKMR